MRQFLDTLGRIGIERLQTQGQAFDPTFHEAVQHFETTEQPPGTIVTEVQAGYKQGDRLMRPALVVVAKAPPN
jgi:molecular chaperone GrpE